MGKLLCFNQSYYEGKYENDKRSGDNCKWYDHEAQTYYFGSFENNKKHGLGKVYDGRQNDVYEGEFQNDKRQGDGVLYKPDGKATKGLFRNDHMEGTVQPDDTKFSKAAYPQLVEEIKSTSKKLYRIAQTHPVEFQYGRARAKARDRSGSPVGGRELMFNISVSD